MTRKQDNGVEATCIDMRALENLRTLGGSELLSDVVELFISHSDDVIIKANKALMTGDMAGIQYAAHSLKSSAGNLGAVQVKNLAEKIEELAGTQETEEIKSLMADLESAYARAKTQLVGEAQTGLYS